MRHSELLVLVGAILVLVLVWRLAWWLTEASRRGAIQLGGRLQQSEVWTRTRPITTLLQQRHPRLYGSIAKRLDPRSFSGLPLTLLVGAALYVASLVAGLAEELLEDQEMLSLDRSINDFFQPYRDGVLVDVFSWLTDVGGSAGLLGVAIVASGFLWSHGRTKLVAPLWVSFGGAELTTWAGKFAFARERPDFVTEVTALSPSFPSAHATGTMAVYGFVAYAIVRDLDSTRKRFEVVFWSLAVVLLVGFSRVFLSVHYASDVVTGFLVGLFWLLVGFTLSEHGRSRGG